MQVMAIVLINVLDKTQVPSPEGRKDVQSLVSAIKEFKIYWVEK